MTDTLSLFGKEVKKIGFFGIGKSNLSLIRRLCGDFRITLRSDVPIDRSALPKWLSDYRLFEGDAALDSIDEDVMVLSPSVRRDRKELLLAESRGVILCSDCELFFSANPKNVFAITGSDGKSTTATLTGLLLRERFKNAVTVGNIGVPMLDFLDAADAFSVELSSFQLSYVTPTSKRAAITNITENHLNWHKSFEEYANAKFNILERTEGVVLSLDNDILKRYAALHGAFAVSSTEIYYEELRDRFSAEVYYTLENGFIKRCGETVLPVSEVRIKENHNLKNLLTALALCDGYVSIEYAREVARSFSGLEHRCEKFFTHNEIDYINSSIDTTPSRCAETLRSLGRTCVVLIGGRSKGASFKPLVEVLRKYARHVVLFGECADIVKSQLSGIIPTMRAENLEDAVALSSKLAKPHDAIILSPAATSYDAYSNFEERGYAFKNIVFKQFERKI